ncbi:MerR family transcriptional regulator [Pseudalkalibacillus hwajinpoensis]|uniref:MerR family transcriptional regulator n=1 Tax=Guptibacillus hwajinpoensis TaxID=208199 RepID=UPI00384EDEE6
MEEYWKIIDFAKQVGKHYNTVDNWFKKIEDKKIHYINRDPGTDEKIYDKLDLRIALYINERRNEKWSLEGIFSTLSDEFELRPFPLEEDSSELLDIELVKKQLKEEMESAIKESAAALKQELLPDPAHERQVRMENIITEFRIKTNLENEAIGVWSQKPETERFKKVGFFRKEEDRDKRDDFVRSYIQERFETKIREEFNYKSGS